MSKPKTLAQKAASRLREQIEKASNPNEVKEAVHTLIRDLLKGGVFSKHELLRLLEVETVTPSAELISEKETLDFLGTEVDESDRKLVANRGCQFSVKQLGEDRKDPQRIIYEIQAWRHGRPFRFFIVRITKAQFAWPDIELLLGRWCLRKSDLPEDGAMIDIDPHELESRKQQD